jgi:hypothetical protein
MEADLLKKGAQLGRQPNEGSYVSVARGCRIMKLARSTYYYRSRRRAAEKKVLRDRVEAPCAEFPRDGYRSHETF